MPLLDHFRPPILNKGSWEGFHGGWPMTMVMDLCKSLPEQYTAEPRVHLGKNFEVVVCTFDVEGKTGFESNSSEASPATATWAPPEPTLTLELDPTEIYEYEVLIFDQQRGRELVAAIELVSPGNKDRGAKRDMFLAKCLDYVAGGACVVVVDVITERRANLHNEIVARLGADALTLPEEAHLYAATYRPIIRKKKMNVDVWVNPLQIGEVLPTMPLRVVAGLFVPVELEDTYVAACRGRKLRV